MAAPRAKTLQQRFGFRDQDLTTPKHDEIMVWLDANLGQVIKEVKGWKPSSEERIAKARKAAEERIIACREERRAALLVARTKLEEQHKKDVEWDAQYPNTPHSKWGVERLQPGVDDCQVAYQAALDWTGLGPVPEFDGIGITGNTWEYPIVTQNNSRYTIGFIDLLAKGRLYNLELVLNDLPKWDVDWTNFVVLFEIKSSIPSLGEAIRQIRMYQTHVSGTYVIVSPDDRFAKALEAQGIKFYKSPGAVADIWDSVA